MKKRLFLSLLLLFTAFVTVMAQGTWQRGEHSFVYTGYQPLADKPITVRYYIPKKGDIKSMRVLFSMHGAKRNAASCITSWKRFADKEGFVVIAPEYTDENGWAVSDYQRGGLFSDRANKKLNPPEKWTYNTIEAIFDYFREGTGSRAEQYDIHGHSAGGQFVHRMVLAMPHARIRMAVASNPSSWTYPFADGLQDEEGNVYEWPYSVKGTPFDSKEEVTRYLATPMILHIGTADTSTTADDLDKAPGAMAQGSCRYERGKAFFKASTQRAEEMNTPCNWRLVEVEGIAHSGTGMVYGKGITKDNRQTYSVDHTTTTGAFYLIYKQK